MSMQTREVLKPDVLGKSGEVEQSSSPLDPCPNCGARPHESPVGVNAKGEAHWVFGHCWKCGFRPGAAVGFSVDALKRQWDEFQAWAQEHGPKATDRGIAPPSDPDEIATLKAQMEAMAADLAQYKTEAGRTQEASPGNPMGMGGS